MRAMRVCVCCCVSHNTVYAPSTFCQSKLLHPVCVLCVRLPDVCVCVCVDQPFSLITWRLYHVAFIISPSHLVCVCAAHCARIIPAELRVCSCTSVESVSSQNTRVGKKVESSTDNSSCSSPSAPLQVRDTCVCVCLSAVCVCVCV